MEFLLAIIGLFAAFCWGLSRLWNSDGTAHSQLPPTPGARRSRCTDSISYGSAMDDSDGDDDSIGARSALDDDWLTNPVYSFYPGNIFHHDDTPMCGCGAGTDSDWMTDPTCSHLPKNIYHEDQFGCSPSITDDSTSCFDSDSSSCFDCSSSAFDDGW